jgi:hypothetical protein
MITDSQNIQSSPIDTCPEIELLLCCARTQPSPEIGQQIQTLAQQSLDWSYLLQTAARHSVLPLLYQNLKTLCPEAVPKPVLSELRNFFHTNAAHNLFLTQELLKILKLFQDNDIPAIPFKGPVLAVSVYGNYRHYSQEVRNTIPTRLDGATAAIQIN